MENLTYELIGKRLKEAREKNNLTQTDVANYLGIKREKVSYYETGSRQIDIITLVKLSNLYGYSLNYFVQYETSYLDEVSAITSLKEYPLTEQDIAVLTWGKKFIKNLNMLNELL